MTVIDTRSSGFAPIGYRRDAVAAMKLKAYHYLEKPIDLDELLIHVDKALAQDQLTRQLEYSRKRERHAADGVALLGDGPEIQRVWAQVRHIASLSAPVGVIPPTVLILGETGTGKDVVARLLHASSARRERPFVHVDCASLPKELIEAELFGHEKGAFTSALAARTGLIEAAEDGVLFLDEIAELPLELQAKLLAILERRTLRRVGSLQERPVEAWFIAATNRDVEEMLGSGRLRPDLYFRLNVLTVKIPPLRARGQDVVLLAKHFAGQTARRYGLNEPRLATDACTALTLYPWPGNVRELKHVVERVLLLAGGGVIDAASLMWNEAPTTPSRNGAAAWESLTLDAAEKRLIEEALARTASNVSEAARQLGVTRMALRYRIKKHRL